MSRCREGDGQILDTTPRYDLVSVRRGDKRSKWQLSATTALMRTDTSELFLGYVRTPKLAGIKMFDVNGVFAKEVDQNLLSGLSR